MGISSHGRWRGSAYMPPEHSRGGRPSGKPLLSPPPVPCSCPSVSVPSGFRCLVEQVRISRCMWLFSCSFFVRLWREVEGINGRRPGIGKRMCFSSSLRDTRLRSESRVPSPDRGFSLAQYARTSLDPQVHEIRGGMSACDVSLAERRASGLSRGPGEVPPSTQFVPSQVSNHSALRAGPRFPLCFLLIGRRII